MTETALYLSFNFYQARALSGKRLRGADLASTQHQITARTTRTTRTTREARLASAALQQFRKALERRALGFLGGVVDHGQW